MILSISPSRDRIPVSLTLLTELMAGVKNRAISVTEQIKMDTKPTSFIKQRKEKREGIEKERLTSK